MQIPPQLLALVRKHGWKAALWLVNNSGSRERLANRQKAIRQARHTVDGRFGSALLEGQLRYVVFAGDKPLAVFPPDIDEDLNRLLSEYNRDNLRRPSDLRAARIREGAREGMKTARSKISRRNREPSDSSGFVSENGEAAFKELADSLPDRLKELVRQPALPLCDHPSVPTNPGAYLFSEGATPMYVGQTRNLKQRLSQHTARSSRENQASFAFRLAEEAAQAENLDAVGTRKQRAENPRFSELFAKARQRVVDMDVRFMEVVHPVERTMLELFVAQALDLSRYNDFETH